jgi:hypothetical protein
MLDTSLKGLHKLNVKQHLITDKVPDSFLLSPLYEISGSQFPAAYM